jgi:hypothetical protein
MKNITIGNLNSLIRNDDVNNRRRIFKIMESTVGIVPLSMRNNNVLFARVGDGNIKYFMAEAKLDGNKVVCNVVNELNVDVPTPKAVVRKAAKALIGGVYDGKIDESIKASLIGAVRTYVESNNVLRLELAPRIQESIQNKVNSPISIPASKRIMTKIHELFNKLGDKVDAIRKQKSQYQLEDGKPFTFEQSKLKRNARFTESFVWNMRRIKGMVEQSDFAKKLKTIYDSYIDESAAFSTLVEEIAQVNGIELMTKSDLAKMFLRSSQLCEYTIDDVEGGNMIDSAYDIIYKTKSKLIEKAITECGIKAGEDIEENVKAIRRSIYLDEVDTTTNKLPDSDPLTNPAPVADVATPDAAATDAAITASTDSPVQYTMDDVKICIDILKLMLKKVAPELAQETATPEVNPEAAPEATPAPETEAGVANAEVEVKESLTSIMKIICETDNDDVVVVDTQAADDKNIDVQTIMDGDGEGDNLDLPTQIQEYIKELEDMVESGTIDETCLTTIIDFMIDYYDKKREFKQNGVVDMAKSADNHEAGEGPEHEAGETPEHEAGEQEERQEIAAGATV